MASTVLAAELSLANFLKPASTALPTVSRIPAAETAIGSSNPHCDARSELDPETQLAPLRRQLGIRFNAGRPRLRKRMASRPDRPARILLSDLRRRFAALYSAFLAPYFQWHPLMARRSGPATPCARLFGEL